MHSVACVDGCLRPGRDEGTQLRRRDGGIVGRGSAPEHPPDGPSEVNLLQRPIWEGDRNPADSTVASLPVRGVPHARAELLDGARDDAPSYDTESSPFIEEDLPSLRTPCLLTHPASLWTLKASMAPAGRTVIFAVG